MDGDGIFIPWLPSDSCQGPSLVPCSLGPFLQGQPGTLLEGGDSHSWFVGDSESFRMIIHELYVNDSE